jgi:glycosyltransferase involved in cell wall biosynthesis
MMIAYNHEKFIAQALDSILSQQVNFDYEIVVGEDCSTDGTREILMDFHRRYPQIILPLLHQRNLGALSNMAATIAKCRGTYLAFLEGDDFWTDPNKLKKQVEFLDAHPASVICCHRVKLLDPEKREGIDVHPSRPPGSYSIQDLFRENFAPTCSVVLRRELIGALPPWHSQLAMGDWSLLALVAEHGAIELMNEVMAVYRVHPGGIWSSRPMASRLREISRLLEVLDKHFDFKYTNVIRSSLAKHYFDLALLEREKGSRLDTARYTLACIRNGGWYFPRRILGGLAIYTLIGRWYKLFSKANSIDASRPKA